VGEGGGEEGGERREGEGEELGFVEWWYRYGLE